MPEAPPAHHARTDDRADLERQYWALVENLHALVDRQQHLANVQGAVLGLAIATVMQAITEGWVTNVDTTVDAINQTLAQRGLPWRLIRPN